MPLTNFKTNAVVAPNHASGYLSGTYTAATVTSTTPGAVIGSGVMTLTLGFAPKYFKIFNVTDRLSQEWFEGMNSGDFIESVAAGDKTLQTDDKVVVDQAAGTVVVTFDGGAVTDDDTVVWEARG